MSELVRAFRSGTEGGKSRSLLVSRRWYRPTRAAKKKGHWNDAV